MILVAGAALLGGIAAFFGSYFVGGACSKHCARKQLHARMKKYAPTRFTLASQGLTARVVLVMIQHGLYRRELPPGLLPYLRPFCCGRNFTPLCAACGLEHFIDDQACIHAALVCSLWAGVFGALMGSFFDLQLGFFLLLVGWLSGLRFPLRCLRQECRLQQRQIAQDLPEMLDVLALAIESGLSIEQALRLYEQHFTTRLSHELALAQRYWQAGILERDVALRRLASTLDVPLFSHVVEALLRTLRTGANVADVLRIQAEQARLDYKAKTEERIAKLPSKMMLPIGVLILPAMLLLVLGPVLLGLMKG